MKKILSIDGGGIRGIIPALVLAEIERRTGKNIADCFDLIAGTSTGGIIALGATLEHSNGTPVFSAKKLTKIYENDGLTIFNKTFWRSVGNLFNEKYNHEGIEKVLKRQFGDACMGQSLTNVLVPTYDLFAREPLFFKSWDPRHKDIPIRSVARATSAAPTYFEPTQIEVDDQARTLIDGGVFINSPMVSAFAEAQILFPGEDLLLISVGTGQFTRPLQYEDAKDWGQAEWMVPLIGCIFDGVADAADYQMQQFLGKNYIRLQTTLDIGNDDMDDASKGNIELLKLKAKQMIRDHRSKIETICNKL